MIGLLLSADLSLGVFVGLLERLGLRGVERGLVTGGDVWGGVGAGDYVPPRREVSSGFVYVDADSALRSSAVWACLNLRARLVANTPVDVYEIVDGVQIEKDKPDFLVSPGGGVPSWQAGSTNHAMGEWLYSSQFDLGRYGNVVGIVTACTAPDRDGRSWPLRVELAPTAEVTFRGKGNHLSEVRVCGEVFSGDRLRHIWHERERTVPGCPVGLSPIMYAAMSIGGYLAAQQFGIDYFVNGASHSGHLRNTAVDELPTGVAADAKASYRAATAARNIFVTGRSWEFTPAEAPEAASAFLDEMKYGVSDICRFMDVPGDLIDAAQSGSAVTYASITQRMVQLLVVNMGPVFSAREAVFSSAIPGPRFVKFATDALLRMDPQQREQLLIARVAGKVLAPSEARALNNLPPFTDEQMAEMQLLGIVQPKAAVPMGGGMS